MKQRETSRKPELLAPAANLTAALTAFDCGADAVYVGLKKFNARERGENFGFDDLAKLLQFSRRKGRKVYVTLNTLIKESELPELTEMLGTLAYLRPDAVIVQDLAVVQLVRNHFPELTLHASTQMAVHNSAGVAFLKHLGVERVILERQVTTEELELINDRADMELEVFVHGALCCCRSGTCLFSSWLGGWSGNRGKCKQPCRRRFFSDEGNGFFFSTSDLYALDAIPDLKKMGIDSFKIEGRLRQADYVRSVVTAYRMMLDADDDQVATILPQAREVLSGSLGRKWSSGFSDERALESVIEDGKLGSSGRFLGVVSQVGRGGFSVSLKSPLKRGDRVRVQPASGDEGSTVVVTKLSVDRRDVGRAKAKQTCFVHYDREVPRDGRVYLIGHEVPDMTNRMVDMPQLLGVLDLSVHVTQNELVVHVKTMENGTWRRDLDLEQAQRRALSTDDLMDQFGRSGDSSIGIGSVIATVAGDYFMPASVLKGHRREFRQWLESMVTEDVLQCMRANRISAATNALTAPLPTKPLVVENTVILNASNEPHKKGMIVCVPVGARLDTANEVVLPDFCTETELPALKKSLSQALSQGVTRVRVTSLYGLRLVADHPGLTVTAGFPLPVANTMALRLLIDAGIDKATIWVELEKVAAVAMVDMAKPWLETVAEGVLPILSTRAQVTAKGVIRDGRGETFTVETEGKLTNVYPDKAFAMPDQGTARVFDHRHRPLSAETSTFNWDHELK